jgi:hypothetical protein
LLQLQSLQQRNRINFWNYPFWKRCVYADSENLLDLFISSSRNLDGKGRKARTFGFFLMAVFFSTFSFRFDVGSGLTWALFRGVISKMLMSDSPNNSGSKNIFNLKKSQTIYSEWGARTYTFTRCSLSVSRRSRACERS